MFVIKQGSIGHASHDLTVNRPNACVRMCVRLHLCASSKLIGLCHKLIQWCWFGRLTKKLH